MGATFVGIADDATAAASNLAGLVILTRPEVRARPSHPFLEHGGRKYRQPSTTTVSPSYASVVIPVKPFSLSAYYQQVSNIDLTRSFAGTVQFRGNPRPRRSSAPARSTCWWRTGCRAPPRGRPRVARRHRRVRKVRLGISTRTRSQDQAFTDRASADDADGSVVFNAGVP